MVTRNSRLLKREEEILHILSKRDPVSTRSLAEALGVSGWTVRRDLTRMEQEGMVRRQHGVVSMALAQPMPVFDTFEERSHEYSIAKQNIGKAAAQLLKPGQHVAMGAGTTTTLVARELALLKNKQLHIMTNALNIAMELAHCSNLQITCTGGDVRSDHYTLTGPVAERALRTHFYDVAVIGVSGITAKEGLTVNGQLDSIPLQIMIEQSRRLIVVADSSKLGQIHYVQIADLKDLDVLVMDRAAPPSIRKELAHAGVELVITDFA